MSETLYQSWLPAGVLIKGLSPSLHLIRNKVPKPVVLCNYRCSSEQVVRAHQVYFNTDDFYEAIIITSMQLRINLKHPGHLPRGDEAPTLPCAPEEALSPTIARVFVRLDVAERLPVVSEEIPDMRRIRGAE